MAREKKADKLVDAIPVAGGTELRIRPPDSRMVAITIGQGPYEPLIVNNVANKVPGFREADEAPPEPKAKRKRGEMIVRDSNQEYLDSIYFMGDPSKKCYGLKVMGFKKGMATMAKDIEGINAQMIKRMLQISADEPGGELVKLANCEPRKVEHTVRIDAGMGKKVPVQRFRACFDDWETTLRITYNAAFLSLQDVINLVANTGIFIGWGELRPEQGGNNGKWIVKKAVEITPSGARA